MQAVVYDTYGSPDVLEFREIDEPVVKDDQVLVRVRATSINPVDWHFNARPTVHGAHGQRTAQTKQGHRSGT
jgi:NADPH:quinone reductase-like Zn-dependent oxidoreductase